MEELSGLGQRMMSVVDVEMHSRRLEQSHSRNLAEAPLVADSQSDSLDKPVVHVRSSEDGPGESSIADCNCNYSRFGLPLSSRGIRADKNQKIVTTAGRTVGRNWKRKPHVVGVVGSEGDRWAVLQRSSYMRLVDLSIADFEGSQSLKIVWVQPERRTQAAADTAGLG